MFKRFSMFVMMVLMSVVLTGCYDTGSGKKVGMITKVAQEGFFYKTYEASIQRGGFNGGTGVNGQAFGFTIENPELAKKVEDMMNRNAEVEISYKSEWITFARSENDNHFLVDIKEINAPVQTNVGNVNSKPNVVTDNVPKIRNDNDLNTQLLQMLQAQNQMLQVLIQSRQSQ